MVRPHLSGRPVEVRHRHAVPAQLHHLVLAQFDGGPRMRDEGGHIGGKEGLALADTHHQRGVAPGAHHHVRLVRMHRDQREGALQLSAHLAHGLRQVPARRERLGEQVRHDFGVGLRRQLVAARLQLGPQSGEVLDDAVVHNGDAPRIVQMGMGIGVGRAAVRGPPGVPDAGEPARKRPVHQLLLQIDELARLLRRGETAVGEYRHTGRVVAPVLEPLEARDDHIKRRLSADVPHDSAHVGSLRRHTRIPGHGVSRNGPRARAGAALLPSGRRRG